MGTYMWVYVWFNTIYLCRFWRLSVSNRPALTRIRTYKIHTSHTSGNRQSQYNYLVLLPFFIIINTSSAISSMTFKVNIIEKIEFLFHFSLSLTIPSFQFRFVGSCEWCACAFVVCICCLIEMPWDAFICR